MNSSIKQPTSLVRLHENIFVIACLESESAAMILQREPSCFENIKVGVNQETLQIFTTYEDKSPLIAEDQRKFALQSCYKKPIVFLFFLINKRLKMEIFAKHIHTLSMY